MVKMNIMGLWVPACQWGPLCSRKWHMSSLWPQGAILNGPPMWLGSQLIYSGGVGYLGMQFQQNLGEPLAAWLLWLWETQAYSIMCFRDEVGWLASITTHPSLRQKLQDARQLMQCVPNQTHDLTEWINSAIHTMWSNAGELPDTVSKWHTYVELTQVVRELRMKQSIFNPNTQGPDDGCFTDSVLDTILNNAPSTSFGSLTVILAPYVGCSIYEATSRMARLGELTVSGR